MSLVSRTMLPWHGAALLLFVGLKIGFQHATPETLLFLLKPLSGLLTLLMGATATWVTGVGYAFPEWGIIVDNSCAGVGFWALAFAVLHLGFVQGNVYQKHGYKTLIAALVISYLLTLPANAFRIYLSLFLRENVPLIWSGVSLSTIHQGTGIAVQVTLLSLLYGVTNRLFPTHQFRVRSGT